MLILNPLRSKTFTHFPVVPVRNYFTSLRHHERKRQLWEINLAVVYFVSSSLSPSYLAILGQCVEAFKALSWVQSGIISAGFAEEHCFPPAPFCFPVTANSAVLAASARDLVDEMGLSIQPLFAIQSCRWAPLPSASPYVTNQLLYQVPPVLEVSLLFLSLLQELQSHQNEAVHYRNFQKPKKKSFLHHFIDFRENA